MLRATGHARMVMVRARCGPFSVFIFKFNKISLPQSRCPSGTFCQFGRKTENAQRVVGLQPTVIANSRAPYLLFKQSVQDSKNLAGLRGSSLRFTGKKNRASASPVNSLLIRGPRCTRLVRRAHPPTILNRGFASNAEGLAQATSHNTRQARQCLATVARACLGPQALLLKT